MTEMAEKKFYTGRGDAGYTDLLGARVPKHHPTTEFIGVLDETTSQIGLARAHAQTERTRELLLDAQRDLYLMMAELAFVSEELAEKYRITTAHLEKVEGATDEVVAGLDIAREFVVPGDTVAGAALDVARTVVRRAERLGTRLLHDGELGNETIIAYLNRLSSLLFVLGRYEERQAGVAPTIAKRRG
jgi:cob(I)alamin adenosyltransferase